jgi:hypothetical protein
VPPRSVNRCIAVAAHGRRCQQTTYRGSPYCWHHTQSRKVWAPSRMQAGSRTVRGALSAAMGVEAAPLVEDVVLVPEAPVSADPLDRVAAALDPVALEALADFLEAHGTGVFRIDRVDGRVTAAHTDPRLSRALTARSR